MSSRGGGSSGFVSGIAQFERLAAPSPKYFDWPNHDWAAQLSDSVIDDIQSKADVLNKQGLSFPDDSV